MKSLVVNSLLGLVFVAVPMVASAEDEGKGGATAVAKSSPPGETKEELKSELERDMESYWGKRRKVAVIQKRHFQKPGRVEINLFGGGVPNDAFVNYLAVGAHATYHVSEFLGLELSGAWLKGFDTNLASGIKDTTKQTNVTLNIVQLEKLHLVGHLSLVFSFIHGKVSILKYNLSHFDLYLAAGGGVAHYVASEQSPTAKGGVQPLGTAALGFKFFLNNWFGFRLEYRQYLSTNSAGFQHPSLLSFGVGFFTKGSAQ